MDATQPTIEVTPATTFDRPILRNLMELYLYDFSEFDGAEIGPFGLYEYPYLDHYWTEPNRFPFLIRVDGQLAGFVLVTRYNYFTEEYNAPDGSSPWVIAEFFVMRKYRQQGVGEEAACRTFERFSGNWQVGQIASNTNASAFWRKVIARYTGGQYQEIFLDTENWHGPVQTFSSPPHSD